MRYLTALLLLVASLTAMHSNSASAAICPTTINTNTDCGFIITDSATGVLTGALVAGADPYDGSDDALIGVVNNSSSPLQSLTLSGSGNGGGLFGFDGDGICTFVTCTYSAPTGYEGPLNTFTNISTDQTTGTILFAGAGLAAGATTYFSLESSPASIGGGGGPTIGGGGGGGGGTSVPEPATMTLLGTGIFALFAARRRRA